MKWEGLYVALSRVKRRDHIRLLVKRGDWRTVSYVSQLEKCEYTDCFFRGYENSGVDGTMSWSGEKAAEALKRLAHGGFAKTKTGGKGRKRRRRL
jgi:hypothetical protein